MSRHVHAALVIASLAACDDAPAPSTPPASAASAPSPDSAIPFAARFDAHGVYRLDASIPLAYRRHLTLPTAKGDQYDNKRAADPENYAVTAPPPAITAVRPMTEWEPMHALVFAYPAYTAQLDQASDTFAQIARFASDHGEVWVLVDGLQAETIFKQKLARAGVGDDKVGSVIKFLRLPFDTYWIVDFGPLPLVDRADDTYAFADFRYYHDRPLDDAIPTLLGRSAPSLGVASTTTTFRMPLTTEGGTFQSTSDGICITSSRQIYNMSCYAGSCRESILALSLDDLQTHPYAVEMRGVLAAYVGCRDLIVTHSITDDGTGHIDMYLKILDDDRVLLGEYRPPFENDYQADNAALMNDNAAFLEAYIAPGDDLPAFQVVRLPMPGHRTVQDWFGTYDVPFTYINSTFFNGLNLWPAYTFNEWKDGRAEAEAIWEQVLPDMRHIWIDSEELSYQSGAIHCVTRTIPAKEARAWVSDGACAEDLCAGAAGGYDGACALNGASDLCWGPEWLCGCNDCRQCPELVPDTPCGSVNWRGCCDAGDVLFCDNARLQRLACAGTGCGWDAGQGFYGCGLSGEDPSGQTPASCGCEPSCGERVCGSDGCGGTCGTCPDQSRCVAGACRDDCADCLPGDMGCDGAVAWRCVAGPEDCHLRELIDCAEAGETCDDGVCVDVPVADPDPEPDVAEPAPETTTPDTSPTEVGADATTDDELAPRGARDSGCGAGGTGPGALFGLAGLILVARYARSARALRA